MRVALFDSDHFHLLMSFFSLYVKDHWRIALKSLQCLSNKDLRRTTCMQLANAVTNVNPEISGVHTFRSLLSVDIEKICTIGHCGHGILPTQLGCGFSADPADHGDDLEIMDHEASANSSGASPGDTNLQPVTFPATGAMPLIGSPWGYLVRQDNLSPNNPQDIGNLVTSGSFLTLIVVAEVKPM